MLKKVIIPLAALFLLATSCTKVYLDKPMPDNAAELRTLPKTWDGVFQMVENDTDIDTEQPFVQCLRFNPNGTDQLLVSFELRLPKKDLGALRAYLEEKRANGSLSEFQLDNGGVFTRSVSAEGTSETAFLNFIPSGDWYIVAQSCQPLWAISLANRRFTEYEIYRQNALSIKPLESQDSVKSVEFPLSLRKKGGNWYLNFQNQEPEAPYWNLYRISETAPGTLTISVNQFKSGSNTEQVRARFEKMMPSTRTPAEDYLIHPDDKTLDALFDDPDILRRLVLKKIADQ